MHGIPSNRPGFTRRAAIGALSVSVLAAAVLRALPAFGKPPGSLPNYIAQGAWAESVDDPKVGAGADLNLLRDQISAFFGTETGRYLADQTVDPTAPPGRDLRTRSICEQFVAIFGGGPEFDATLTSGARMVVRFHSNYKAAVFLEPSGLLVGTALTFDFCPVGGVDQELYGGSVHTECLWPFSAVFFYRGVRPDPVMSGALVNYLGSLPMQTERAEANGVSNGKIKIKVFARKL